MKWVLRQQTAQILVDYGGLKGVSKTWVFETPF